ncbi:MAG: ribokinase [Clostridiales bacterium]|nr:ribokinase [Clostridiales bacterium]
MKKILCFGSLNMDYTYRVPHFVCAGETLAASKVQTFCGGKGLNQSIALAKAGGNVYHAGSIGSDGAVLLEALKQANINTELVTVLNEEKTGHAIIQNTPDGENCILLFSGANKQITTEQIDLALERFESGDLLVLQNEINRIPYLIQKAKAKGMTVAFTPAPVNEEVSGYPLEETDYILLNETEARALTATEQTDKLTANDLADKLREAYPSVHFVLTLGSAGAFYIHKQTLVFQSAFSVKSVDTTAAGDTFAGYFLQSVTSGQAPKEALKIAAKAAAICVTRRGASGSIPDREEVASADILCGGTV